MVRPRQDGGGHSGRYVDIAEVKIDMEVDVDLASQNRSHDGCRAGCGGDGVRSGRARWLLDPI